MLLIVLMIVGGVTNPSTGNVMAISTHLKKITSLPVVHRKDFADLLDELENTRSRNLGIGDFLEFVKMVCVQSDRGGRSQTSHHQYAPPSYKIGIRITSFSGLVSWKVSR